MLERFLERRRETQTQKPSIELALDLSYVHHVLQAFITGHGATLYGCEPAVCAARMGVPGGGRIWAVRPPDLPA